MDPEIIGALIAALATIIAAIISGRVAVKIKNMELKTKKVKGRELVTKA